MQEQSPSHIELLSRCQELALRGLGKVSPNPLVGAVIVQDGAIIGEGFHGEYGGPHAEVAAIRSVSSASLLKGATLYVNLEPCSHWGKTPPCVEAIREAEISTVFYSMDDPNPLVAGKGAQALRAGGITVHGDQDRSAARELNRRFLVNMGEHRPYIILKWAETRDGYIARSDYSSRWISGETSRRLVHQWRSEEDGVLVGTTTAVVDNPQLNVRHGEGRDPIRIALDRRGRIPKSHALRDRSQRTLLVSEQEENTGQNREILRWPTAEKPFWPTLFSELYSAKKIGSLIVEGGSTTIQSIIKAGVWDEARVFQAPNDFGEGIRAPTLSGEQLRTQEKVGVDLLSYFRKARF
ncbi:bifunctional diaminohydroxyphosphoribosylaminopyrimidine deaminase/5-amino-6-(5-phosphoribosylamino)uracil reductase RibD [bacterium]|nr:bifunctional diaminohydroxyphosphoribosylaminopyrimidine deaminase/5-amino-6-(5-phosphoribosylamino)uracil reductase RibD [bacterium]